MPTLPLILCDSGRAEAWEGEGEAGEKKPAQLVDGPLSIHAHPRPT
jgi:hypothetical protein